MFRSSRQKSGLIRFPDNLLAKLLAWIPFSGLSRLYGTLNRKLQKRLISPGLIESIELDNACIGHYETCYMLYDLPSLSEVRSNPNLQDVWLNGLVKPLLNHFELRSLCLRGSLVRYVYNCDGEYFWRTSDRREYYLSWNELPRIEGKIGAYFPQLGLVYPQLRKLVVTIPLHGLVRLDKYSINAGCKSFFSCLPTSLTDLEVHCRRTSTHPYGVIGQSTLSKQGLLSLPPNMTRLVCDIRWTEDWNELDEGGEMNDFWPKFSLCCPHLTYVDLSMTTVHSSMANCDIRGFAKLATLKIRNYTFRIERPLLWLLSPSNSLTSLTIDSPVPSSLHGDASTMNACLFEFFHQIPGQPIVHLPSTLTTLNLPGISITPLDQQFSPSPWPKNLTHLSIVLSDLMKPIVAQWFESLLNLRKLSIFRNNHGEKQYRLLGTCNLQQIPLSVTKLELIGFRHIPKSFKHDSRLSKITYTSQRTETPEYRSYIDEAFPAISPRSS